MYDTTFIHLTVTFAIITGTGAGLLSVLTWNAFRRSPFGKVIFVLTFTMAAFTVYHALLIVLPSEPLIVELFEAAVYTGVAGFVVMMLHTQRHMNARTAAGGLGMVGGVGLVPVDPFTAYELVMGLLSSAGLLYLLYVEQFVGGYRRFVVITTLGVLIYSGVGPLFELFAPGLVHAVHGFSASLVILGLYSPVRNDLRTDDWAAVLLKDPSLLRSSADWMVPMDERILELLHVHDLVLTPAVIARNLGYSREAVNRRLATLADRGLVERVEKGKYCSTSLGDAYLLGRLDAGGLGGEPVAE